MRTELHQAGRVSKMASQTHVFMFLLLWVSSEKFLKVTVSLEQRDVNYKM
jgi:hypothetical protein